MLDITMPKQVTIEGREYDVVTWYSYMGEARAAVVEPGMTKKNDYLATVGVEGYDTFPGQQHVGYFLIDNGPSPSAFGSLAVKAIADALQFTPRDFYTKRSETREPLDRIGAVSTFPSVTHLDVLGEDYDDL